MGRFRLSSRKGSSHHAQSPNDKGAAAPTAAAAAIIVEDTAMDVDAAPVVLRLTERATAVRDIADDPRPQSAEDPVTSTAASAVRPDRPQHQSPITPTSAVAAPAAAPAAAALQDSSGSQLIDKLRTMVFSHKLSTSERIELADVTGAALNGDLLLIARGNRKAVGSLDALAEYLRQDKQELLTSPVGAFVRSATAPTGHSPSSVAAEKREKLIPAGINTLASLRSPDCPAPEQTAASFLGYEVCGSKSAIHFTSALPGNPSYSTVLRLDHAPHPSLILPNGWEIWDLLYVSDNNQTLLKTFLSRLEDKDKKVFVWLNQGIVIFPGQRLQFDPSLVPLPAGSLPPSEK